MGFYYNYEKYKYNRGRVIATVVLSVAAVVAICATLFNTAGCQRSRVSIQSDFSGGLEGTAYVYTFNGELIDEIHGKIDVNDNENGSVMFDVDGVRYLYYDCSVKIVRDIN